MAFGSALSGGTRDAGVVRLVADTGSFNADIERAERQWRESVNSMSREAIRLDLAQDRLRSSLAKYGAESNQAKRATLQLKDAEEQATRSSRNLERAHERQRRSLTGMRGAALGAAGAFLGTAGLVTAIRSVVDAQREAELVMGQTQVAVEQAGLSWEKYEKQINDVIKAQSKLGFDDEKLLKTFSTFVTRTGDVTESLKLNALATDVARGRYIELEQAAQIVLKASLGQAGALRRIGIDAKTGASGVELITLLTEKYAGRAEAASRTGVAAQDRLNVAWENAREIIGSGLTPTINEYADRLAKWLDDADNQAELQKRVNGIVKDGAAIVRGFAGALKLVKSALSPVVDLLGGAENAAKTLFIVLALSRLARVATAVRGIGTAFGFMATQATAAGVAAAEAEAIAMAGGGGLPGRGGRTRIPPVGVGPVSIAAAAGIIAYNAVSGSPQKLAGGYGEPIGQMPDGRLVYRKGGKLYVAGKGPGAGKFVGSVRTGGGGATLIYEYTGMSAADAAAAEAIVAPGEGRPAPGPIPKQKPGKPTGGATPRGPSLAVLERNAQRALLDDDLSNDLAAAKALEAYYRRKYNNAKKGTKAADDYLQGLVSAHQQVESVEGQIAAEDERHDQAVAEARAKARAKAKARQDAEDKRDRQANADRVARRQRRLKQQSEVSDRRAMRDAQQRARAGRTAGSTPDSQTPEGLTRAGVARAIGDFLGEFNRVQSQYASNMVVHQTFNTQADPDPAYMLRGARYAAFQLRAAIEG